MQWIYGNTTANVRFGVSPPTSFGVIGLTLSERPSVSQPGEFTSRIQATLGP